MATKTLIALFENRSRADDAAQGLKAKGFSSGDIRMKAYDEYSGGVHEEQESPLRSFLRDIGLIESKPEHRGARTDETLVMLYVDDEYVDDAADILNRHGALNLDERMAGYQPSGETSEARGAGQGKIEEVEEELEIGTRPVSRGGVRVYTRPTEREVEQPVTLREEEVHVERKPVDRPASEGEARGAFQEESFEVRAEGEEPVVSKEARVKEEVSISKEPVEHRETIRETLHGTKVETEELSPETESGFSSAESEFHNDFERTYSATGASYDDVRPAYRYGYSLGRDPFYKGNDWRDVEPKVRKDWEDHNYERWDFYAEAVHKGWEEGARRH